MRAFVWSAKGIDDLLPFWVETAGLIDRAVPASRSSEAGFIFQRAAPRFSKGVGRPISLGLHNGYSRAELFL